MPSRFTYDYMIVEKITRTFKLYSKIVKECRMYGTWKMVPAHPAGWGRIPKVYHLSVKCRILQQEY